MALPSGNGGACRDPVSDAQGHGQGTGQKG